MKKNKFEVNCYIREDLESILLRFEHGEITLNESLELIIGDLSDQLESLVETINGIIQEVSDVG